MKLSERWLRELVEIPVDTDALADDLTMLGLEVDGVEAIAGIPQQVVAGEVLALSTHPDADRLRLCRVSTGGGQVLDIVCGAPNVRVGGVYPLALPGARLPGGQEIAVTRVRGVESSGMLCSAAELGLPEDEHESGLLELFGASPGTPVADALALPDHVLEINLTPNRADCFSALGIARELAARYRTRLQPPELPAVATRLPDTCPVEVSEPGACPVFTCCVLRGLDPSAPTPTWMRERLRRAGLRPLQLIVDVTNYVMLETGQPLHAYELAALSAPLGVRSARSGETLVLLDGKTLELAGNELLITDASGPIGLAGIMGGSSTAVQPGTTDILLESAHFTPERIAGRARLHGLQTDASMRFERGVDPALPARALARATSLLLALAGGEAGALTEHGGQPARLRAPITLRQQRLDALLGTKVPAAEVTGHLRALGLEVEESPGAWQATPPSWRFDLAIEEDLVEEVARLHGYDQLPRIPGQLTARLGAAPDDRLGEDRIRGALVDRGFQEVITYSFIRPDHDSWFSSEGAPLPLANPISAELANMRRSVWPGLAQVCAYNLARQQGRVRIFEIGAKFSLQDSVYKQVSLVSGLLHGGRQPDWWQGEPQQPADFFDLKGDVSALLGLAGGDWSFVAASHPALHPGRCARIERDGEACGWIGELHPALAERLDMAGRTLLFEIELAALARCKPVKVAPVSRFPATRRDLAIVVARELPVAELLATVREAAGPVLVDSFVFDVYTGSKVETSQKSIALGLILQETSRTLTDEEVAAVLQRVSESLSRHHQARIRDQAWH